MLKNVVFYSSKFCWQFYGLPHLANLASFSFTSRQMSNKSGIEIERTATFWMIHFRKYFACHANYSEMENFRSIARKSCPRTCKSHVECSVWNLAFYCSDTPEFVAICWRCGNSITMNGSMQNFYGRLFALPYVLFRLILCSVSLWWLILFYILILSGVSIDIQTESLTKSR